MLRSDTGPADEDAGRLDQILRAADRAASSLTRQLLAFSRRQVLEPRRRRTSNALVRDAGTMLRRLIGE